MNIYLGTDKKFKLYLNNTIGKIELPTACINMLTLAQEYASTATYIGADGSVGYANNSRLSSSSPTTTYFRSCDGVDSTALIPIKPGDVLRFKNCNFKVNPADPTYGSLIFIYKADKSLVASTAYHTIQPRFIDFTIENDEYTSLTMKSTSAWDIDDSQWAYVQIGTDGLDETSIITVNEEIN